LATSARQAEERSAGNSYTLFSMQDAAEPTNLTNLTNLNQPDGT